MDGVLRTLCGEAIGELIDDHFYDSATNAIIAETVGMLAPVAAEEALTEVRAQAFRDQLIEGELQAWMKIIAEETLAELHGTDSQVRANGPAHFFLLDTGRMLSAHPTSDLPFLTRLSDTGCRMQSRRMMRQRSSW